MKQSHIWYFTDRIKEKQKLKVLILNSKQNEWYRIDSINAFSKLSLLSEVRVLPIIIKSLTS